MNLDIFKSIFLISSFFAASVILSFHQMLVKHILLINFTIWYFVFIFYIYKSFNNVGTNIEFRGLRNISIFGVYISLRGLTNVCKLVCRQFYSTLNIKIHDLLIHVSTKPMKTTTPRIKRQQHVILCQRSTRFPGFTFIRNAQRRTI